MEIITVNDHKKDYLDLLLLADEQESMIDHYLQRGRMFAFYDQGELIGTAVVTDEGDKNYELKSIVVYPRFQNRGFGKEMVRAVFGMVEETADTLWVGTGDTPKMMGFYQKCGFRVSHRVKDFFSTHYDHPMVEEGVLLRDMVYLRHDFR